ncbi:hypothetical protein C8R44DRAFT_862294 [Mycena epipterygia]|nr:hypothetical protein C8R44DRAFT_862294 [Mycena epipterygia]
MSPSRNEEIFPRPRAVNQPPPLLGELVDGRLTSTYILAWVCPPRKFFGNLGSGKPGEVDYRNFTDVISHKWGAWPDFDFGLAPLAYPGADGNFYLIAMFNKPNADHLKRVLDMAEDPLIQSARVSMGVDQDPSVETQWFLWSLYWLQAEEPQRERARLEQLQP